MAGKVSTSRLGGSEEQEPGDSITGHLGSYIAASYPDRAGLGLGDRGETCNVSDTDRRDALDRRSGDGYRMDSAGEASWNKVSSCEGCRRRILCILVGDPSCSILLGYVRAPHITLIFPPADVFDQVRHRYMAVLSPSVDARQQMAIQAIPLNPSSTVRSVRFWRSLQPPRGRFPPRLPRSCSRRSPVYDERPTDDSVLRLLHPEDRRRPLWL